MYIVPVSSYSIVMWPHITKIDFFLLLPFLPLPIGNTVATYLNSIGFIRFSTILPLCWVVGYIVLLAPGGLGVREGMLTLTLSEFLSPEIALTIAIIQRVWFILVEGFNFLTSFLIKPEKHKSMT